MIGGFILETVAKGSGSGCHMYPLMILLAVDNLEARHETVEINAIEVIGEWPGGIGSSGYTGVGTRASER